MQTSPNKEMIEYAGFWPRLIAYLVDLAISGIVIGLIRIFALNGFGGIPIMTKEILFHYSILDIVTYLLRACYFIVCVYYTQTTVGKYLMKLKVVGKDGEKLSLFCVIYRETIGRFLSSILYVGYLLIIIDKEKTALHDKLCDSRVIYGCTVKKTVLVKTMPAPPPYQPVPPMQNQPPTGGGQPINYNQPPMGGGQPMNYNQPPMGGGQPMNYNQPSMRGGQPMNNNHEQNQNTTGVE